MTPVIATSTDTVKATGAGLQAVLKSAGTTARASQTIGIEWVYFVRQSVEQSMAAAKKLAKADSLSAAMEIQSDFAKASYERLAAQATTFRDLYAGLAAEMAKPFAQPFAQPFANSLPAVAPRKAG